MARSCSEHASDAEELDIGFDWHTHIHIDENLQDEVAWTKLTKAVAAKASPDVPEETLSIEHRKRIAVRSVLRLLTLRPLTENAANLAVIDSRSERRR